MYEIKPRFSSELCDNQINLYCLFFMQMTRTNQNKREIIN